MAHILTDTTSQVNKQAETLNQGGPLAITKLDMQQNDHDCDDDDDGEEKV